MFAAVTLSELIAAVAAAIASCITRVELTQHFGLIRCSARVLTCGVTVMLAADIAPSASCGICLLVRPSVRPLKVRLRSWRRLACAPSLFRCLTNKQTESCKLSVRVNSRAPSGSAARARQRDGFARLMKVVSGELSMLAANPNRDAERLSCLQRRCRVSARRAADLFSSRRGSLCAICRKHICLHLQPQSERPASVHRVAVVCL